MRSSRAARETHALHVNFSPHAARKGKHRGGMTLCFGVLYGRFKQAISGLASNFFSNARNAQRRRGVPRERATPRRNIDM